jgi:uncharacterized metal-binding protein
MLMVCIVLSTVGGLSMHISATLERQFRDDLNTATAVLEHKNGGI